jgi:diacylglycerol kinase
MRKHTISFINASKGIWTAITTQSNLRIHFLAGSLVLLLATYLQISLDHIIDLILVISLVITAEMVNTSMEFMCDAVTLEHNENIKFAKDVSAGAVLISAIFAVLIGLVIFIPKFL